MKVQNVRFVLTLTVSFLAYAAYWSYVSIIRYYSLSAGPQLMVNMLLGWEAVHGQIYLINHGIAYALFPIFLSGSYISLIIFGSAVTGLGAFPLYGIATLKLKDRRVALLIAISYLLYFPLAGISWSVFSFQSIFPALFLFGYYFYLKKMVKLSFISFALSSLVGYPYSIFVLAFGLGIIWKGRNRLGIYLAILSAIALTAEMLATNPLQVSYSLNILKFYTVFLILLPLLFLPLLSKWALMLIPYLAMLGLSSSSSLFYPQLFFSPYPALFIAFVYLGAIDGLKRIKQDKVLVSAVVLFLSVSLFATAYEPYSPVNRYSTLNYNIPSKINWANYDALAKMVSLIPENTVLLVQSNMPDAFPHRNVTSAIVAGYTGASNISAITGVLMNPFSSSFNISNGKSPSMNAMISKIRGDFGVAGESNGTVLLLKGYTGPVKYYVPLNLNVSPGQFGVHVSATNLPLSGQPLWYGPYLVLPQGTYNVTFMIEIQVPSAGDFMEILEYVNNTGPVAIKMVHGQQLSPGLNMETLSLMVNSPYERIEFSGYAIHWYGAFNLMKIEINQIKS
ncbi:MAG: DUF2079 domain-containing protein [Nitrososphaeria archaeon]